jgi:hypothetical protein
MRRFYPRPPSSFEEMDCRVKPGQPVSRPRDLRGITPTLGAPWHASATDGLIGSRGVRFAIRVCISLPQHTAAVVIRGLDIVRANRTDPPLGRHFHFAAEHGEAPQNRADRAHLRPTCGQKSLQDFRAANAGAADIVHRNALGRSRPPPTPLNLCVIGHSMFRMLLILGASTAARADSCPGNPDALGTERVLAVDTVLSAGLAANNFQTPCRWRRKEIVLTFDDGPWPSTTPAVLDALKDECVRATFCSGATRLPIRNSPAASATKDRGIIAANSVVYGRADATPVAPFFRFPGFASSNARPPQLSRDCNIRRRPPGEPLGSHDTRARIAAGYDAPRSRGRRYHTLSRYQIRNRRHAAGVA